MKTLTSERAHKLEVNQFAQRVDYREKISDAERKKIKRAMKECPVGKGAPTQQTIKSS